MSSDVPRQREESSEDLPEGAHSEVESADVLGLAHTADSMDALRSLIVGYRRSYIAEGFCEEAAEEMAVRLHDALLEDWFG